MLPLATVGRTYSQGLTGSLTALAIPTADLDVGELVLISSGTLNVAFNSTDTPFPVPANMPFPVPVQKIPIFVSGSGTVYIMALGYGAKSGWKA